jgi:hypothetical protein
MEMVTKTSWNKLLPKCRQTCFCEYYKPYKIFSDELFIFNIVETNKYEVRFSIYSIDFGN